MIPKEIIEKAIESGWKPNKDCSFEPSEHWVLDPLFWQALGNILGWGKTDDCWGCGYDEGATQDTEIWFVNAHHFFDLLLTGGDTAKFWSDLIKN